MHRAVLLACWPWFLWLCLASVLALLMVQYCGGRIDWRRITRLRRCEEGAVHSLSLVLTLPVFLMLVLFIVQMSQIMVGIMMVHYAAFAGARAASVWIPMDVTNIDTFADGMFGSGDDTESMAPVIEPANVVLGNTNIPVLESDGFGGTDALMRVTSVKFQKIAQAAVIPLLTISPSRSLGNANLPGTYQATFNALARVYPEIDPASKRNRLMPTRLRNKLAYAANATDVYLIWHNVSHPVRDVEEGPTYNPYKHPDPRAPRWNPQEIGYRDPVTVQVVHRFGLLPGMGRILQRRTPERPDRVAPRIGDSRIYLDGKQVYWTELTANATFVNEGYKSVLRYAVQP